MTAQTRSVPWWTHKRAALLARAALASPLYVLDAESVAHAVAALRGITTVTSWFYAMKANPHRGVLDLVTRAGFGLECVSRGEVDVALPFCAAQRVPLLYTPNFAGRTEVAAVLGAARAVQLLVTIDNVMMLQDWPALFAGRDVLLRVDAGVGLGHHAHVQTAGAHSKFGVAQDDVPAAFAAAQAAGARVIGLHAHAGSLVLDPSAWAHTARTLARLAAGTSVRILDVGGGLGVPMDAKTPPLDLAAVDAALGAAAAAHPGFALWMEPGRYVVAHAGVLLATVTQTKRKGFVRYVGVDAGMNALVRPALYGATHTIVNLSRLDEDAGPPVTVVGPICESGDVLGRECPLPPTHAGDVLLIADTGAYGRAMASHYNLRAPPDEVLLLADGSFSS